MTKKIRVFTWIIVCSTAVVALAILSTYAMQHMLQPSRIILLVDCGFRGEVKIMQDAKSPSLERVQSGVQIRVDSSGIAKVKAISELPSIYHITAYEMDSALSPAQVDHEKLKELNVSGGSSVINTENGLTTRFWTFTIQD